MAYGLRDKDTGDIRTMRPEDEKKYFGVIQNLTGIDEPMARTILESRKIDHPKVEFFKLPVEPK